LQSKDYHIGSDQIQCRIEVFELERTAQHRISIHELKVQKNEKWNKDLDYRVAERRYKQAPKVKTWTKSKDSYLKMKGRPALAWTAFLSSLCYGLLAADRQGNYIRVGPSLIHAAWGINVDGKRIFCSIFWCHCLCA